MLLEVNCLVMLLILGENLSVESSVRELHLPSEVSFGKQGNCGS